MMKKSSQGLLFVVLALFCAYVYAKFQGGFVSWFILYTILPIMIVSLLVYLTAFRRLRVERKVEKQKCRAGEAITVTLHIHNPFRFPLIYLQIHDDVDPALRSQTDRFYQLVYPGFRKRFSVHYVIRNIPRGVYNWEQITLKTGDLFGLVQKEIRFHQEQELVVYPRFQNIRFWRTYNEKNTGMSSSFNRQDEDVSSLMGIRDYVPGDRLARIHWKATARMNTLKTKEYEHQVTNDLMFFLDREMAHYKDCSPDVFERAVSLTASLTRYALKQRFSTGLVSYGERPSVIKMSKDQEQIYRIFEHLARIRADAMYSFIRTVLREVVYLPTGTTVVIVTPKLHKKIALLVADLSYRKIKVELFFVREQGEISQQEKECLTLLEQIQTSYRLIVDDHFSRVISGGELRASGQ